MKSNTFKFLPFRFDRKDNSFLITNEVGDYHFLSPDDFQSFVNKKIDNTSEIFYYLKSKGFLYTNYLANIIDSNAIKYRTRNKFLFDYTSLHMFVVTLRCNQKCSYCHASSKYEDIGSNFDMDSTTAKNSVDIAFETPSKNIKIEFQGGEPLLNFEIIKIIVDYANELKTTKSKNVEFVVCTNLTKLEQTHLDFFKENNVVISTSLDGPRDLHNRCRKMANGGGTYDIVINNIKWALDVLGEGQVSSLLTVTPYNIDQLGRVVDEYIENRLEYIFIRKLNPFGNAYQNEDLSYSTSYFIDNYKKALDYIIKLNKRGIFFPEIFATILLSRIFTPYSTGFVDLQSPTGGGISGVIYDTNGDVFISDEARMIFHTNGDNYFCLGNVNNNNWRQLFCNEKFKTIVADSCIDAIPGCAWCVYKPYCGSDPVRNYLLQGDMVGYRPENEFCEKNKAIFNLLFDNIKENDEDTIDVFWSWLTNRGLESIRLENTNS